MIAKQKLLIATTNTGKQDEILHTLTGLSFDLLSLEDLSRDIEPPLETGQTLGENAQLKARYYAGKSGLLTIAEDTGLFVEALGGWPGIVSARVAPTVEDKSNLLLHKMHNIPDEKRQAYFETAMACYDPIHHTSWMLESQRCAGFIGREMKGTVGGHGYDPVFIYPQADKTFAEMTITEKNAVSHRGKALERIKYYLQNVYGAHHVVVPLAFIFRDGKMLMGRRHDPARPTFHGKWEFPGGKMEYGEDLTGNVIREIKEETGYDIDVIERLNHITIDYSEDFNYQAYLIPHLCRITGGSEKYHDAELSELKFFNIDELKHEEMIGKNLKMYVEALPEIKRIISLHKL